MSNSLASVHPELVAEWSDKNLPLTPEKITFGSNKKVWWKGACGHEWETSVKARSKGEKCPICSGARVIEGINDLATLKPHLIQEWSDKNHLKPTQVSVASHKKVIWKCKQGHEWTASIKSRTVNGTGCPYCSHNKVLEGFNDLASKFPQIALEWSERNLPLLPTMVTAFANSKAWWKCRDCGNEWYTLISTRSSGSKCPYCSGYTLLKGFNDLATTHPNIAAEWSDKNYPLKPDEVNAKSRKNVWWHCKTCGNEWKSVINARVIGGDSDTVAAICGGVAEAYYGIPSDIRKLALTFLDETMVTILNKFESKYGIILQREQDNYARSEKHESTLQNQDFSKLSREEQIALSVELTNSITEETSNRTMLANELHSFLYGACTILYGAVLPSKYKTYVLPLMFLKRVCDCFDEEEEIAKNKYGEDWVDFDEDEIHRFMIPEGCHWKDIRNCVENVGSAILNAMQGIEAANPGTLSGLFTGFDEADWTNKNMFPDKKLKDLVEHFSERNLGNKNYDADIMGDANEYLIRHFADDDNKNAGDFFTPRTIVKLLVKMLAPKANHSIYDPACGTGGMLIEYIRQTNSKTGAGQFIYGQENMTSTSAIARMNLYLHGIEDFHIKTGDTLRQPQFIYRGQLQKFDYVVANPPFGLRGWGAEQFETDVWGRNIWGCPSDSNADYAWIQHIVASMNEKEGRAAIIMPQGVLFHSGKEGKIRKELIKSHKLEAVINLPSGVFYSTGVSACVIFLNNKKPEEREGKTILIDASTIVHARRAQKYMDDSDIDTVYKLFADFEDLIDFAKVVTEDDLKAKGYTLAVNSYIEKTPPKPIDPKEVKKNYMNAYNNMIACEAKLKSLLREGGYIDE